MVSRASSYEKALTEKYNSSLSVLFLLSPSRSTLCCRGKRGALGRRTPQKKKDLTSKVQSRRRKKSYEFFRLERRRREGKK